MGDVIVAVAFFGHVILVVNPLAEINVLVEQCVDDADDRLAVWTGYAGGRRKSRLIISVSILSPEIAQVAICPIYRVHGYEERRLSAHTVVLFGIQPNAVFEDLIGIQLGNDSL